MKTVTLFFLCLLSFTIFGQSLNDNKVQSYQQLELLPGESCLWVPMDFNNFQLIKEIPDSMNGLAIQRIDLVYTTFKLNPEFDQEKLNANRVQKLKSNWPSTNSELIEWNSFGQTQGQTVESAREMFHGFVVYYRATPTKESIEKEIEWMDELLGVKTATSGIVASELTDNDKSDETRNTEIHEEKKVAESNSDIRSITEVSATTKPDYNALINSLALKKSTGCYNFYCIEKTIDVKGISQLVDSVRNLKSMSNYVVYTSGRDLEKTKFCRIFWAEEIEGCSGTKGILHSSDLSIAPPMTSYYSTRLNQGDYSIVQNVFERNPDWTNTVVVMDVTGSMSPYIAQTMAWLKAKEMKEEILGFVFFNDGDGKSDAKKKIGSVGGVYAVKNLGFDVVYDQMKNTMYKGGGGDCPENNIEASIFGLQQFPDGEEIVMIADNLATPRDLSLVKELDKPVHVILCGSSHGANIQYIQLAYNTGGSVHTMEQDLKAEDIVPGKTTQIGNTYVTVFNGQIIKATNKY